MLANNGTTKKAKQYILYSCTNVKQHIKELYLLRRKDKEKRRLDIKRTGARREARGSLDEQQGISERGGRLNRSGGGM